MLWPSCFIIVYVNRIASSSTAKGGRQSTHIPKYSILSLLFKIYYII